MLSLKSASCFALKKEQASQAQGSAEQGTEQDSLHAAIDDLREYLLSL
jgi:hypothetical protein